MAHQSISGSVIFNGSGCATLHVRMGDSQDDGGVHILSQEDSIIRGPDAATNRPPSGLDVKNNILSGEWPAAPDKASKTPGQFASKVNNIQRSLFAPPYGRRGAWSLQAQQRLLEWLLLEPIPTASAGSALLALPPVPAPDVAGGDVQHQCSGESSSSSSDEESGDTKSTSSSSDETHANIPDDDSRMDFLALQEQYEQLQHDHEEMKKEFDDLHHRNMILENDAGILDTQNQLLKVEIAELKEQVAKKQRT